MNLKFIFFSFLLSTIIISCQPQKKEIDLGGLELPEMVYPKHRRWMSPDNGDLARFKSPSLQWPSRNSNNYEVRLATNPDFTNDLISIEGITFSFFNIHKALKNGSSDFLSITFLASFTIKSGKYFPSKKISSSFR